MTPHLTHKKTKVASIAGNAAVYFRPVYPEDLIHSFSKDPVPIMCLVLFKQQEFSWWTKKSLLSQNFHSGGEGGRIINRNMYFE